MRQETVRLPEQRGWLPAVIVLWLVPAVLSANLNPAGSCATSSCYGDCYKPPPEARPPFNCSDSGLRSDAAKHLDLSARGLVSFDNTTINLDSCYFVDRLSIDCNNITTLGPYAFGDLQLSGLTPSADLALPLPDLLLAVASLPPQILTPACPCQPRARVPKVATGADQSFLTNRLPFTASTHPYCSFTFPFVLSTLAGRHPSRAQSSSGCYRSQCISWATRD